MLSLVSGGPTPTSGARSTFAPTQTIVAGTDRIAVDALGAALLKTVAPATERVTQHAVFEHPMLVEAAALKLGAHSAAQLDVAGPRTPHLLNLLRVATARR